MAVGRDIDETESIRIAELFLGFIVISLLFGRLMKYLEHNLKGPTRRGLRHTVHHIEEELLALGVISLILIVAEDYLLKICVDDDDYKKEKSSPCNSDHYNSSSSEEKHSDKDRTENTHNRKMLAGGGDCSAGDEPFWSGQTIHQTHIFIFMVAIVHVLYATASFLLCLWRMQRWKRYEKEEHVQKRLEVTTMMYGQNRFEYWFWSFGAQFSPAADESLYLAMRLLFIERLELESKFDFHMFLVNTLVDEFAVVVQANWVMWVMVAIWILVPQLLFVTTALSVLIVLVIGTKLQLVGLMLSQQAYLAYDDRQIVKPQSISTPHSILKKPIAAISNRLTGASGSINQFSDKSSNLEAKSVTVHDAAKKDNEDLSQDIRRTVSFEDKDRLPVQPTKTREESKRELLKVRHDHEISPNRSEISKEVRFETESPTVSDTSPTQRRSSRWLQRGKKTDKCLSKNFSTNYQLPDSATLFWFGRPQLLLLALQFVYFETAMAIALVSFDLWQSVEFIIENTGFKGSEYLVVVVLIIVGVLCLLQTSFLTLPTYALTMVAGSHCPESVIKHAEKMNIKISNEPTHTGGIEFLRTKSALSRLHSASKRAGDDAHGDDHHGDGGNTTIDLLIGAMVKGRIERDMKEQREELGNPSSSSGLNGADTQISVDHHEDEEDDEEMQAIIEAFGSFSKFLDAVKASQEAIKRANSNALFNLDSAVGSYHGKSSNPFDLAAINLTFDLKAAEQEIQTTDMH